MQTMVPKGRVNYEPNSLGPDAPRECPARGFTTTAGRAGGEPVRLRAESFADHYSQAGLFFRSQTEAEQSHIAYALTFELSKVETPAIRERVVAQLRNVDEGLAQRVAKGLRLEKLPAPAEAAKAPDHSLPPSPALSIIAKSKPTLKGRMLGCLTADGVDGALLKSLKAAIEKEGAMLKLIATKVGGVMTAQGDSVPVDMQLAGAPSVLFDAAIVAPGEAGVQELMLESAAKSFVADAFAHLKIIGYSAAAEPLLEAAGVKREARDEGVIALAARGALAGFIEIAKRHRIWEREPKVRLLP
jgi:catalase